jgi:hypothetical protein
MPASAVCRPARLKHFEVGKMKYLMGPVLTRSTTGNTLGIVDSSGLNLASIAWNWWWRSCMRERLG